MEKEKIDIIKDKVDEMPDSDVKAKILKDIEVKKKHKIINKDGVRN